MSVTTVLTVFLIAIVILLPVTSVNVGGPDSASISAEATTVGMLSRLLNVIGVMLPEYPMLSGSLSKNGVKPAPVSLGPATISLNPVLVLLRALLLATVMLTPPISTSVS